MRGQLSVTGLLFFAVLLIIGLALAPTIGTQTNTALSNTTLFPRDGPAYLAGSLTPFIFFIVLIISGFIMMQGGQKPEG